MLNVVFNGLGYGAKINALLWVVRREIAGKTIDMMGYQKIIAGTIMALGGVLGFLLTSSPKTLNNSATILAASENGAFAYSALSSFVHLFLMFVLQCQGQPCWEPHINKYFIGPLVLITILIFSFTLATTVFPFEDNHKEQRKLIVQLKSPKETIKNIAIDAKNSLINCPGTMFSKCKNFLSKKEKDSTSSDDAGMEMTMLV